MDPVEMRDEEVLSLREKTSRIVHALDPELNFHDFRVLKENEQRNLIFDLVIPDSYSEKDANRVMHQLVSLLHEMDENVECIITLDRSFEAPES
jgi:hypothetical protein